MRVITMEIDAYKYEELAEVAQEAVRAEVEEVAQAGIRDGALAKEILGDVMDSDYGDKLEAYTKQRCKAFNFEFDVNGNSVSQYLNPNVNCVWDLPC